MAKREVGAMLKRAGVDRALVERMTETEEASGFTPRSRPVNELIQQLGEKIDLALHHLNNAALAKAPARDLSNMVAAMIEKKQLLEGQPTAIVSVEHRMKMDALLEKVVKEAQRRGVVVDLNHGEFRRIE